MRVTMYVLGGVVALVLVLLGGFFVQPAEFEGPAGDARGYARVRIVPIPDGLPAPVERWLRADYPNGLPAADGIVMRGRGVMRIGPIAVPMRHRVEIKPGAGFLRRMDLTWYGIAFAHGKDTFVEGRGVMVTPVGTFDGAKIDQGANVVNWLEVLAVPGVLAERDDVRWEPIDDSSARLVYPFAGGEDEVVVYFSEATGAPEKVIAERYQDADATAQKVGWTARMMDRREIGGLPVPGEVDATWEGADKPWATFGYSDVWVNAPLTEYENAARAARGEG